MISRAALPTLLVCLLLHGLPAIAEEQAGGAPRPPNVVFLLADDLGWADVGYQGGPFETPNIDALAGEGLRLLQHYVQPTCSPTRAELLTGRRASRVGLVTPTNRRVFDDGQPTLATMLAERGYFTALTGKWHLGSNPAHGPTHHGFQESYGALAGGLGPYDHKYRHRRPNWFRNDQPISEEGHATDLIARQAVAWIEQKRDAPFFLYVPFTAIHTPMREPESYLAPYRERFDDERLQLYGATVTHLDHAVGEILGALRRAGLDEQTLVVFSSDNGATRAEHNRPFRGEKGQATEGSIRVPTIVRWTGRVAPGELHAPVAVIDWLPTIVRLAGAEPSGPAPLDGRDIWPLIVDRNASPPERALYFRSIWASAVRQGRLKFVVSPGGTALYDVEADPSESEDLSGAMPDETRALRELLEAKEAGEPPPRKES
jgi:arylsulfatase A-like enzyme